jgi:hypothetical protein
MMPGFFKGMSMRKRLVVFVFAALAPVWAQSQGQSGTLAQAAAESNASRLQGTQLPVVAAPADGTPAFVSPPLRNTSQAPAPMQVLPAWSEVQPTRSDASAAHSLAVEPPLSPVVPGLAVATPIAQSASDPMSQDLVIAQQIHQGLMSCELGASVRVEADAAAPGYFHVQGKGFRYRMYPVRTSTGALRLEDKKAGIAWLQLANKSMLMDQKKGRRVADECAHPEQVAFSQDMKTNPPPSLFDKTGMGRSND